jgi:serine/threonine protein phosphatase PrpC
MNRLSTLRSGFATDVGPQRQANEDRIWADDAAGIFLVVDGLGGHPAGEFAAQTAVDIIVRNLHPEDGGIERQVRDAITAANNEIFQLAQQDAGCSGMACVLTLAVAQDDTLTVGHVGDSRLYLVWNGNIRKLTSDHSPVGEQEDSGHLTETEAMTHPRRNEVFRDVGSRPRTPEDDDFIDIRSLPFHPDGALLLCSDGLTDSLTSTEIASILETYNGDPADLAERLVAAANESGGTDNVSVVFVAGPDFIGVNSPAMLEARKRHAITRVRGGRARWRRRRGRLLWLGLGMLLGILLWLVGERFVFPAFEQSGLDVSGRFIGRVT